MRVDQADRSAVLERLVPFLGEWSVEASFPGGGPTGASGRVVFEWALGGQFLLERVEIAHPDAPDGLCVIGVDSDGDSYTQHYFDSRGIARLYAMTLRDGVWTLTREAPDFTPLDFSQRFTGTFAADGATIDGRWETARDGAGFELDFELRYTRLS
jgi:hypothetical protein